MARLTKILLRRDTATNWSNTNPVLDSGEPGYDTTNSVLKIGNGTSTWSALGAPSTTTYSAGNGLALASNTFSLSVAGCKVTKATTQSLTTGTVTAITFGASDTEDFDTHSFHSTSTNTSRITIPSGFPTNGKWLVNAGAGFATNATGYRYVAIYRNGAQDVNNRAPANGVSLSQTLLTTSTILLLSATDYVEMHCFQDSGGSLNVTNGAWSFLSVVFLGA